MVTYLSCPLLLVRFANTEFDSQEKGRAMANQIDWDATGSMLSGIGTIVGAIAVLLAALVARISINQFRTQKITERLVEHAERILTATYKAHYALDHVRGRMLWAGELEVAEKKLRDANAITGKTNERDRRMISAQVYLDRLSRTNDDKSSLVDVMPTARALWGKELETEIQKLHHQFWLIECNATELADTDDRDRLVNLRRMLGGKCAKDEDELSVEVRRITSAIEEKCLPVLRSDSPDMEAVAAFIRKVGTVTIDGSGGIWEMIGAFTRLPR